MVIYRQGNTPLRRKGKTTTSILEIDFENGLVLYAFPGFLSPNDIIVRFKNSKLPRTQIRQPKHIHWAVDILVKKEKDPKLTEELLSGLLERWQTIKPVQDKSYETLSNSLKLSKDTAFIAKYKTLDKYGYFSVDFIVHLVELLMIQEKTNYSDAYMFREVVEALQSSRDLYAIISKATHTSSQS